MRKAVFLILVFFSSHKGIGQITILGNSHLNGNALVSSKLFVYGDGKLTYTLNTHKQSEFMLKLDFGKIYSVYIQHPSAPLMHFEVIANTIPNDKYHYHMTYEFMINMADKWDEDIDTSVYQKPFHRIVFNGINRLVADTAYNLEFSKHILKKTILRIIY